jgi:hypothetical protein
LKIWPNGWLTKRKKSIQKELASISTCAKCPKMNKTLINFGVLFLSDWVYWL